MYPENLVRVLYIRYPINFGKKFVLALLNLGCKFNTIYPTFAKDLGFPIRLTEVKAQKIDGIILDTYRMIVAAILV